MTLTADHVNLQTNEFELDQIICSSFGYDMTIVEFYVVARMTKASVWLRPIGRIVTGDDGQGEGKAIPDTSVQASDCNIFRKRIQHWDNVEGISDSIKYFRIWDGKPQYHNTWDWAVAFCFLACHNMCVGNSPTHIFQSWTLDNVLIALCK